MGDQRDGWSGWQKHLWLANAVDSALTNLKKVSGESRPHMSSKHEYVSLGQVVQIVTISGCGCQLLKKGPIRHGEMSRKDVFEDLNVLGCDTMSRVFCLPCVHWPTMKLGSLGQLLLQAVYFWG